MGTGRTQDRKGPPGAWLAGLGRLGCPGEPPLAAVRPRRSAPGAPASCRTRQMLPVSARRGPDRLAAATVLTAYVMAQQAWRLPRSRARRWLMAPDGYLARLRRAAAAGLAARSRRGSIRPARRRDRGTR